MCPSPWYAVSLWTTVCKHIFQHLEEHNLLISLFGFQRHHSCGTQECPSPMTTSSSPLIEGSRLTWPFWISAVPLTLFLMNGSSESCIIWRGGGILNVWVRSFLLRRTMTVAVSREESAEPFGVLSGVPQGTILGPLLFLVYINDITDQVSPGTLWRLFVDDFFNSLEDQLILQHDLDALHMWTEKWEIWFNPMKCYIMHVCRAESSKMLHFYELCNTVLLSTTDSQVLGNPPVWGFQLGSADWCWL